MPLNNINLNKNTDEHVYIEVKNTDKHTRTI